MTNICVGIYPTSNFSREIILFVGFLIQYSNVANGGCVFLSLKIRHILKYD